MQIEKEYNKISAVIKKKNKFPKKYNKLLPHQLEFINFLSLQVIFNEKLLDFYGELMYLKGGVTDSNVLPDLEHVIKEYCEIFNLDD